MIIELGLASEATKGKLGGMFLEFSLTTGAICVPQFSNRPGNIDGCA